MIWCGLIATWHSQGNQVSKTRFPHVYDVAINARWNPWKSSLRHSVSNRGFSNFKVYSVSHSHCHSHPHPHTLTLKPEHSQCQTKPTYSHCHSQCQTKPEHSSSKITIWVSLDFFSTPRTTASKPRTPTAALPLRTASRAYSTWNKWPSGEILQSARWSSLVSENQKKKGESLWKFVYLFIYFLVFVLNGRL